MRLLAQKTATIYLVVLGMSGLLYFVYTTIPILLLLLIAIILAVTLDPLVQTLMRRGIRRSLSIAVSLSLVIAIIIVIIGMIATPLVSEGSKFAQAGPQTLDALTSNSYLHALNSQYGIIDYFKKYILQIPSSFLHNGASTFVLISGIAGSVSSFIIILILTLFLLIEGPSAWHGILSLMSRPFARRVRVVGDKSAHAVRGFVSGNLFISLIAGTITLVTLLIMHVPYPYALAALVALFDLIPLVGAAAGTVVVGVIALSQGITAAAVVVGVLLLYQFIEGHIIQPLVYSRSIKLSPLMIIIASLVGAEVGGIVGVLLAIPVAAVLQIVVIELASELIDD